ncbi:uncharacterized protein LOC143031932 isoform X2 [Oratosquilla oratoria]|uniref:uncharacterized protein LOC143031932 isoform X2 n=1 Tax=Oratosquilla oratoria TaxID=337810 RepID=UPI003F769C1B
MADSGTGKEWQFLMKNIKERLQYMYTSEEYSDLDIVFPKYELTFKYIISNMKEETLLAVLETSVVYEDKVLNNKCKEMLDLDPDTSLLSETVSYLSKESLKNLLMDRSLKFSSEIVPFKTFIAW